MCKVGWMNATKESTDCEQDELILVLQYNTRASLL